MSPITTHNNILTLVVVIYSTICYTCGHPSMYVLLYHEFRRVKENNKELVVGSLIEKLLQFQVFVCCYVPETL